MNEHPILFSAPMVHALLAGTKTQTRREITDRNSRGNYKASELLLDDPRTFADPGPSPAGNPGWYLHAFINAPLVAERRGWDVEEVDETIMDRLYPWVFPGDRLWVKETWQYADWTEDGYPFIGYRADGARICQERHPEEWSERLSDIWADLSRPENYDIDNRAADRRWRPSIFMPRWASRITLEVTGVRVERVQQISAEDALAEGVTQHLRAELGYSAEESRETFNFCQAQDTYRLLWESINGAASWQANPWVWVVEFKRVA